MGQIQNGALKFLPSFYFFKQRTMKKMQNLNNSKCHAPLSGFHTINLPIVLYGCETWSLTLRDERKLSVFENMALRRIFGPMRVEVTGE